jgi:hypothetical protein
MNIADDLFDNGKPIMKKQRPADTIIMMPTRDAMHDQLTNKVRLNRYDMKFMVNIAEKYTGPGKPLSPGQNTLYEKIVHKYRKQLKKLKVDYRDILALPWQHGIVPLEVLNQKTYFRIADDEMQLYFNFHKQRIEEVRAIVHDDIGNHLNRGRSKNNFGNGQKYNFNWFNPSKSWRGPFNVYLFKQLYEFAKQARVRIDSSVRELCSTLDAYGTKEDWTPSIRLINDRMYVNHITETMLPFLDKIDPDDTSFANIERLAELGLAPPDTVSDIAEYVATTSMNVEHILKNDADVKILRDYIIASDRKVIFHIPELDSPYKSRVLHSTIEALGDCNTWTKNCRHFSDPMSGSLPIFRQSASDDAPDTISEAGYNTLVTTTPVTGLIRAQSELGKFALKADKVIHISLKETK